MVYETKGFSLEQVDDLYDSVKFAWKSKEFVPTSLTEIAEVVETGSLSKVDGVRSKPALEQSEYYEHRE